MSVWCKLLVLVRLCSSHPSKVLPLDVRPPVKARPAQVKPCAATPHACERASTFVLRPQLHLCDKRKAHLCCCCTFVRFCFSGVDFVSSCFALCYFFSSCLYLCHFFRVQSRSITYVELTTEGQIDDVRRQLQHCLLWTRLEAKRLTIMRSVRISLKSVFDSFLRNCLN